MNRLLLLLTLAAGASARAETIAAGDTANGALLFRVQCAACHGADGRGGGPLAAKLPVSVGNLRDPAFLVTRSDDALRASILNGVKRKSGPMVMPPAPWLNSIELADILAFLRHGELRVADFFPQAQYLFAKTYALDKGTLERLQKRVGHALSSNESHVTVASLYGDGHSGGPEVVPDDPVQLDKLDPKQLKGYLVFAELPQGKTKVLYGIALDPEGVVKKVASLGGAEFDKPYQGFIGLGDKKTAGVLKPKGKGKGPTPAEVKGFNDAFARVLVGVDLADREEKDRHWADTK